MLIPVIDERATRTIHAAVDDEGLALCGLVRTVRVTRPDDSGAVTCGSCKARLAAKP